MSEEKNIQNEEKRIEKIVTGEVSVKKKSSLVLFANRLGIIPEDVDDVKDYILKEQIVPTAKNLLFDILQTVIFGSSDRRRGGYSRGGGGKTSYERYYYGDRRDDRDRDSKGRQRSINYDEIVFKTRGDAEYTLDALQDLVRRYGSVSIADIYDMAGITNFAYTYNKYGWDSERDIADARISRVSDGFIIKLPKPYPID